MKTAHVSATSDTTPQSPAEIIVNIYGPRGGTRACVGLSPEQAHTLGVALMCASANVERELRGIGVTKP